MPPVGGFVALSLVGNHKGPEPLKKAEIMAHFSKIDFAPNSDYIKGKIMMHFDPYRISHEGIKVKLEGYMKLNQIGTQIYSVETTLEGLDLVHGQNRPKFHFTFPPHRSFPISFESSHVSITYRISADIKRDGEWENLDKKSLKFNGYYNVQNLGPNPFVETKLMSIKTGEVKSTFRVPNTVTIMGQRDGLQGVLELHGLLEKSQVDATVTFLRNTSYGGDTFTKVILSKSQHSEMHQNTAEFTWNIGVPMMKQISYSDALYSVRYYLKYEVLLGIGGQQYADANGTVEVQIGTIRHSHTSHKTNEARNQQPTTSATTSRMLRTNRRGSIMSLVSMLSLPPAYSQLSSRFGSVMSLETLPPRYDDLRKEE